MFKNKEEFKTEYVKRIVEMYGRTIEEAHVTEKFACWKQLFEIKPQLTGH